MTDLEEIRRRKMLELQQRAQQQAAEAQKEEQLRQQFEIQKRQLLMKILTPEARSRLANLRLTRPEFVEQIELQLIQLAQAGQIRSKITDEQLKELLRRVSGKKRDIKIVRR
ncbi:MAG TPA: DNA-binding protein [Methanothermobacter sp.]|nr:DNA-binding protein [Methanothermobacter sp. MT-2]HHW05738.1 DNA-binding protein [Methanothermobacter sp.]HOK72947.1 DNA-binding protein [Methanothermobacter sp.]HOL69253.1 DNA-binding protein [Methanothermobacter sp.]HPQ04471.1 DNA-binding protein [Methanothermobacter sp.]